jgi:hypothetical protein
MIMLYLYMSDMMIRLVELTYDSIRLVGYNFTNCMYNVLEMVNPHSQKIKVIYDK